MSHDAHAEPAPPSGRISGMIGTSIIFIAILGFLILGYSSCQTQRAKKQAAAETAAITRQNAPSRTLKFPEVVYDTTPATIIADYGFNIEADAPIMVQYPGQEPVLYTPGKGCKQLPEPRYSGSKKFWDPRDKQNGHVAFRLYRVGGPCG